MFNYERETTGFLRGYGHNGAILYYVGYRAAIANEDPGTPLVLFRYEPSIPAKHPRLPALRRSSLRLQQHCILRPLLLDWRSRDQPDCSPPAEPPAGELASVRSLPRKEWPSASSVYPSPPGFYTRTVPATLADVLLAIPLSTRLPRRHPWQIPGPACQAANLGPRYPWRHPGVFRPNHNRLDTGRSATRQRTEASGSLPGRPIFALVK